MDLLCRDDKLNISKAYLRPGTPYGGSCLPKDVSALVALGRKNNVSLPVLEHLAQSNRDHLQTLLSLVEAQGAREVVFLGLTFKEDTDDLRESPMLEAAQFLLGRGFNLRIFDPYLNLGKLTGRNEEMVRARIPHLQEYLIDDLATALGSSGVVVLSQKCAPLEKLQPLLTARHHVIDLIGWDALGSAASGYEGICW
jgi:GDP-mannose 6-dehydrogenase